MGRNCGPGRAVAAGGGIGSGKGWSARDGIEKRNLAEEGLGEMVSRTLVEGLTSDSRGKIPQLQQKGSGFGEEMETSI